MKRILAAAVITSAVALNAFAQSAWPERPIRFIVPTAPGGPTDQVGRQFAERLAVAFKQAVIVENRAGAGHLVGMAAVAQAAPDGYTFGVVSTPLVVNPSLHAKMPYNTVVDLEPVSLLSNQPLVVVTGARSVAASLPALLEAARKNPGTINMGSAGNATGPHLAGSLLAGLAAVSFMHVPYKGGPQATLAVIGGEVDFYIDTPAVALPHLSAGKLRALAVTSPRRMALLPDVPTVAEFGYPGYEFDSFTGLVAPRGTPPEILARMQVEIHRIATSKDFRERLAASGIDLVGTEAASFKALISNEIPKWKRVVEASRITAD